MDHTDLIEFSVQESEFFENCDCESNVYNELNNFRNYNVTLMAHVEECVRRLCNYK